MRRTLGVDSGAYVISRIPLKYRRAVSALGFDVSKFAGVIRDFRKVRRDRKEFVRQLDLHRDASEWAIGPDYPIYGESRREAGQASGHYFHQDLFVARSIHRRSPRRHVDVGSSIHGFVAHVASFREIDVIDVRPVRSEVRGITFHQVDAQSLPPEWIGVADSVSCLHALEHFGLGRYGDPVEADGWLQGLASLTRMLEPGGTLYLSVPTGARQRVEFNAHRVFALPYLRAHLERDFEIEHLAFVDDEGALIESVDPYGVEADRSMDADDGLSIWILAKRNASSSD